MPLRLTEFMSPYPAVAEKRELLPACVPVGTSDLVGRIAADALITTEESRLLRNALAAAGGDHKLAHRAVELYFRHDVEFEPQAQENVAKALLDLGYAVEAAANTHDTIQSHISTGDPSFERVLSIVGEPVEQAHVAVLDGGFDLSHPAFAGRLHGSMADGVPDANGLDLVHGEGLDVTYSDLDVHHVLHGTHVLGLATRGSGHVQGTAVRVIHGDKRRSTRVREAIEHAVKAGARIVNMSFGVNNLDDYRSAGGAIAENPDVLFVVAAGNWGADISNLDQSVDSIGAGPWFLSMPVADRHLPNLVLVAAADAGGNPLEASNYGAPCVNLAIRGEAVVSSAPGGHYEVHSGTSMAAPKITNIAAKCSLLAPNLGPSQMRTLLELASPHRPEWEGKITAAGPIDPERAYYLAAVAGALERGECGRALARKLSKDEGGAEALLAALRNSGITSAGAATPKPSATNFRQHGR